MTLANSKINRPDIEANLGKDGHVDMPLASQSDGSWSSTYEPRA